MTNFFFPVCTPIGFVRLFGVVGSFLVKPQFLKNLDEEFNAYKLEEDCIKRRLELAKATGKSYISPVPMSPPGSGNVAPNADDVYVKDLDKNNDSSNEVSLRSSPGLMCLRNGALQRGLAQRHEDIKTRRRQLDEQRRTWWVRRTLLYPIAMLALLVFSTATALLALQNTIQILVGIKALPISTSVGIFSFLFKNSLFKLLKINEINIIFFFNI